MATKKNIPAAKAKPVARGTTGTPSAKAKPVARGTTGTPSAEAQAPADTPNTPEGLAPAAAAAPPLPDAAEVGDAATEVLDFNLYTSQPGEFIGTRLSAARASKTHLRVAARVDGFRRCGRAWPASGDTVAKTGFTPDQVERLLTDPDLVVTEVDG